MDSQALTRFLKPQSESFATALAEIQQGRKKTHWMWYLFPQIKGLGFSEISRYYAISNIEEAKAYLKHPVLAKNLLEISQAAANIEHKTALEVFGSPDDLKLHSSMTLFSIADPSQTIFQKVLDRYFDGKKDSKTMALIGRIQ